MNVRWRVRVSAVCATVLTAIFAATGSASAAVSGSQTQIQQFEHSLSRSASPTTQLTLRDFKKAPFKTQVQFLSALSDPATFQADMTVTDFTYSTSSIRSTAISPLYATYDVTTEFHASVTVLGIAIMTYTQQYKYETGLNKVLNSYSCNGWVSGFAGVDTFSFTSSMWITGGLGSCDVLNSVSFVYKGLGYLYTKEGYMQTSGAGLVYWWVHNV